MNVHASQRTDLDKRHILDIHRGSTKLAGIIPTAQNVAHFFSLKGQIRQKERLTYREQLRFKK